MDKENWSSDLLESLNCYNGGLVVLCLKDVLVNEEGISKEKEKDWDRYWGAGREIRRGNSGMVYWIYDALALDQEQLIADAEAVAVIAEDRYATEGAVTLIRRGRTWIPCSVLAQFAKPGWRSNQLNTRVL